MQGLNLLGLVNNLLKPNTVPNPQPQVYSDNQRGYFSAYPTNSAGNNQYRPIRGIEYQGTENRGQGSYGNAQKYGQPAQYINPKPSRNSPAQPSRIRDPAARVPRIVSDITKFRPQIPINKITDGGGSGLRGNNVSQELLRLVNLERSKAGAKPLKLDSKLMQAAQTHSDFQARTKEMTHQGRGEESGPDRAKRAGWKGGAWAENVAVGMRSPADVMRVWMESPGHKRNILDPNMNQAGFGLKDLYWTQVFGSN